MSTCWPGSQSSGRWRKIGVCCSLEECDHSSCWAVFWFFARSFFLKGFILALSIFFLLRLRTTNYYHVNSQQLHFFLLVGGVLANVLSHALTIFFFSKAETRLYRVKPWITDSWASVLRVTSGRCIWCQVLNSTCLNRKHNWGQLC